MTLPRLMVLGYARHGKDTLCEMLRDDYGYTFVSSSRFVGEKAVWPKWVVRPGEDSCLHDYEDFEEFFANRAKHRAFWYQAICAYNAGDPGRLGRELYSSYPIYCGIRNKNELFALRNTRSFDHAIWVDRSDSVKAEDKTSCTIEPWMADWVLDNNGTLADTRKRVRELMEQGIGLTRHPMHHGARFPYELREASGKASQS